MPPGAMDVILTFWSTSFAAAPPFACSVSAAELFENAALKHAALLPPPNVFAGWLWWSARDVLAAAAAVAAVAAAASLLPG